MRLESHDFSGLCPPIGLIIDDRKNLMSLCMYQLQVSMNQPQKHLMHWETDAYDGQ